MSASVMRNFYAPPGRTTSTPREKLAAAADCVMLASRRQPFQPWEFLVTPTMIELHADFDQAADSEGREVILQCGTALFHLRLALKQSGALGRIELFPLLGQPNLLARVHYGASPDDDAQSALFAAMNGSEPAPPSQSPAPDPVLEELADAAAREHVSLDRLQSEESRQRLLDCVHEQERVRQTGNTAPFALRLRIGSAGSDPAEPIDRFLRGQTAPGRGPFLLRMARAFDFNRPEAIAPPAPAGSSQLAVIKTREDNSHAWLAAGQALARVLLTARTRGASTACLNQATCRSVTRSLLRTSFGRKGYPQMILRFGFPAETPQAASLPGRPALRRAP